MARVHLTLPIAAPPEMVFAAVSHPHGFQEVVPEIVKVEILSDVQEGVGTRFRETRSMKGREVASVMEITEHVPHQRVRYVSDNNGTLWDSLFTVTSADAGCELELTMTATTANPLKRLINASIMGVVKKAVAKDMHATKAWCEAKAAAGEGGDHG